MRKSILTALLIAAIIPAFAQTINPKTKTTNIAHADVVNIGGPEEKKTVVKASRLPKKDTTKYQKVIKLSVNDYQTLMQLADAYKQVIIYDPKAEDKVKMQQNIDQYLFNLPKRALLDSIKVGK